MTRNALMLLLIITVISGCATIPNEVLLKRQQAIAHSDTLIVPGERVGPIKLGMNLWEVQNLLGPSDFVEKVTYPDPKHNYTIRRYWNLGLEISFSDDSVPVVIMLRVVDWKDGDTTVTFQTSEGIKTGSSTLEAKRSFPSCEDRGGSNVVSCNSLGMNYAHENYKLFAIGIYKPRF